MVGCWVDIVLYAAIGITLIVFAAIFVAQGRTLKALNSEK